MSDISELFDRDPLGLNDQDIATIVAYMREKQAQYELGLKAVVAPKPKAVKTTASQNLLKDLGLA